MDEIFDIDGSMLEGGGQILRISVSLSAILGIPIRVSNIRAGRSKPGLAAQHLIGIKLIAEMCDARLSGAEIGSTQIEFKPGRRIKQGHYVADTRTAGSITLLLQVALPCAILADGPVTLDLKGGTNADFAPQVDYFTGVFMKMLEKFGVEVNLSIVKRGYYPKGGGHVTVQVEPIHKLKPVTLVDRGDLVKVYGWSFVSGKLPIRLTHQMVDGVMEEILPIHKVIQINAYKEDYRMAPDNSSGIVVVCNTTTGCVLGADGLGKRGADAHDIGRKAGFELKTLIENGACVDNHTQDQMIIYMALAEGSSAVRCATLTLHTKTAIHIAELIAKVKFSIQTEGEQNVVECEGLRYTNKHFPSSYWEERNIFM